MSLSFVVKAEGGAPHTPDTKYQPLGVPRLSCVIYSRNISRTSGCMGRLNYWVYSRPGNLHSLCLREEQGGSLEFSLVAGWSSVFTVQILSCFLFWPQSQPVSTSSHIIQRCCFHYTWESMRCIFLFREVFLQVLHYYSAREWMLTFKFGDAKWGTVLYCVFILHSDWRYKLCGTYKTKVKSQSMKNICVVILGDWVVINSLNIVTETVWAI